MSTACEKKFQKVSDNLWLLPGSSKFTTKVSVWIFSNNKVFVFTLIIEVTLYCEILG